MAKAPTRTGSKGFRINSDQRWAYLMVAPTIIGLLILNIYPFIITIVKSFYQTGAFGMSKYIGLKNYGKMFASAEFWQATGNTLLFVLWTVPVGVFLALIVAVLLNSKIKGRSGFRGIYFLPMIVAPAAVAMVWKWLFNGDYGIINFFMGMLGLPDNINWLSSNNTVLFACSMVAIWSAVGYDAILILSGLQNIGHSYYEAADIDGASPLRQFFSITLPMVSPTLFFVIIMRLMTSLKVFDLIYMLVYVKNPALSHAQSLMYLFYRESFIAGNKGYASAICIWSFFLIAVFTVIQFIGQKKWVHYDE